MLRAKIALQNYNIGKCTFLVNSQILNWANKPCFREELPLGSLGSKKLATSDSSFTKASPFHLLKSADANVRHAVTVTTCTLLNFIQVHLVKVKYVTGKLE
jgi:hypothetical protein